MSVTVSPDIQRCTPAWRRSAPSAPYQPLLVAVLLVLQVREWRGIHHFRRLIHSDRGLQTAVTRTGISGSWVLHAVIV